MKKRWLSVVGLVLVLALAGMAGCTISRNEGGTTAGLKLNLSGQNEGIWVNGQGEVTVVPDIATLRLGVETQEATVAEAQAQAAPAMDKVITALKDNGVDQKDIKTQHFSIQKVTRWDKDREREIVIGYQVSNVVSAKIRDIDQAGTVIDAVAAAGGDLVRIDDISFSVDDPAKYYAEARDKAMKDAKAKAEQLAQLGGVKLGKPTYISEGAAYPVYPRLAFEKAAGAPAQVATPISPGEMKLSLNIQVVYAIL